MSFLTPSSSSATVLPAIAASSADTRAFLVRPFTAADAPAAAVLLERVMRSKTASPPPLLADGLERYFLRHPWADPGIPALVCEDRDGQIVGFLGSMARRLIFDGRPIRLGCSGPLLRAPGKYAAGVGIRLLRRYFAGPQDLTISDGGNDTATRLWLALGGRMVGSGSLEWVKFFRPFRFAVDYAVERGRLPWLKSLARPFRMSADALFGRYRRDSAPLATVSEELTAEALAAHAGEVLGGLRLRPAYDRPFADWLFSEMGGGASRGPLCRRLVRGADGCPLGWHVSFAPSNAVAQVLQIAAKPHAYGAVLDDLFQTLREHGVTAARGRLEPMLITELARRRVLFRPGLPALMHARDRDILGVLSLGDGLVSLMDGEWWLPLHLESYGVQPSQ
ncbi:MAG TPA: hypothetical protein VEB64_14820 [Azospirillaceae bacterium]|nr:hypothetical protein [Azospirillaceae bacterium]